VQCGRSPLCRFFHQPSQDGLTNSYPVRIDFISHRQLSVSFIYEPVFGISCCDETDIGIEVDVLKGNCYQSRSGCSDCDPVLGFTPTVHYKSLKFGDTVSYKVALRDFHRRFDENKKMIGFFGTYHCRVWRKFTDIHGSHRIYSNWLYI